MFPIGQNVYLGSCNGLGVGNGGEHSRTMMMVVVVMAFRSKLAI